MFRRRELARTGGELVVPSDAPAAFSGYLFICGLHRSGTTLVEQRIAAGYDVACLRADVPQNEGQHLQDVYPIASAHGGPGRFAFAPEMVPKAPWRRKARAARARLLACWTTWATQKTGVLLEKSPPNLTKIAWLRAVFPGARFLIVVRDPEVVTKATRKWMPYPVEEILAHWDRAHEIARADLRDDCMVLRYEDYIARPETEEERIAAFAGLAPRAVPLPLPDRFQSITDRNEGYRAADALRPEASEIQRFFGYP